MGSQPPSGVAVALSDEPARLDSCPILCYRFPKMDAKDDVLAVIDTAIAELPDRRVQDALDSTEYGQILQDLDIATPLKRWRARDGSLIGRKNAELDAPPDELPEQVRPPIERLHREQGMRRPIRLPGGIESMPPLEAARKEVEREWLLRCKEMVEDRLRDGTLPQGLDAASYVIALLWGYAAMPPRTISERCRIPMERIRLLYDGDIPFLQALRSARALRFGEDDAEVRWRLREQARWMEDDPRMQATQVQALGRLGSEETRRVQMDRSLDQRDEFYELEKRRIEENALETRARMELFKQQKMGTIVQVISGGDQQIDIRTSGEAASPIDNVTFPDDMRPAWLPEGDEDLIEEDADA